MSWAMRRQHWIIGGGVVIFLLLIGGVGFALLHKAPMCTDGKQNGKEQGIDCGGPCPYLCSINEAPLQVRFSQTVSPSSGRTDLIAYIDNSNANAGITGAKYTATVYSASHTEIAHISGSIAVPPATTIPLYIPRAYEGQAVVTEAFVTFASSSIRWIPTTLKPAAPVPSSIQISPGPSPRVTATLQNTLATTRYNVRVVATVFDTAGNAIAASATLIPTFPAQGSVPVLFTWNVPFIATPARVEILPAYGS